MESVGQFERLIRMVQETGERVVVSFEKGKDPVVLLPLSVYEQLVGVMKGGEGSGGGSRGSVGIGGDDPASRRTGVRGLQSEVPKSYSDVPRRREPEEIDQMGDKNSGNGLKSFRTDARADSFRIDVPLQHNPDATENVGSGFKPFPTNAFGSGTQNDAVDSWDGEEGGEYDAERIFAQIDREKMNHTPSRAPDRLQVSVSRASEALHGGWPVGSGGQRLPIRGQTLQGEERFSLGAG